MIRIVTGAMFATFALLGAPGCGVSSEDEPQPVEESIEEPRESPTMRSSPSAAHTTTSKTTTSPPPVTGVPAPVFTPNGRVVAR